MADGWGDLMTDEPASNAMEGEAGLRIEGGLAHFPGLAREQIVQFCDLPTGAVQALIQTAEDACFFDQPDGQLNNRPDARTYVVRLTIGARSHEARICEPISNPALAKLVSTIRQLSPLSNRPRPAGETSA
jgi:hypothetical protein